MNEAELLFTHLLDCQRQELYLNKHALLDAPQGIFIASVLKRRLRGEPMQYILGKTDFMGLELKLTPDVFIPRPETEIVAETAIEMVRKFASSQVRKLKLLDVGTGSGCIAIAMAKANIEATIDAIDISHEALSVAQ